MPPWNAHILWMSRDDIPESLHIVGLFLAGNLGTSAEWASLVTERVRAREVDYPRLRALAGVTIIGRQWLPQSAAPLQA